jgi:enoyl-CoA hydratase/carnithine racemase
MAEKTVLLDKQEGLAIITLNRPEKLNAQNRDLRVEFEHALDECENDDNVRVVLVTGAGNKAFSSGMDIHEMADLSESEQQERVSATTKWIWRLATFKKPTIGAINGLAYGGGTLLASLFDIRTGCEKTTFKFLGAAYGRVNSTWTLPYIVGWPVAKELLFTGRLVSADEALRIGLLNTLFDSDDLLQGTIEMARTIAANDAKTVQGIKDILNRDIGMSWQNMMLNETNTVSQTLKVPPPKESFKDFLNRRPK